VVFDLGKVLLDFDYGIAAAKIVPRGRCSEQQVRDALAHSSMILRFESGLMSNEEFADRICSLCGFSGTREEFYDAFADIFTEIKPMTALHAALRAAGIPTCIFSNTNGIAIGHVRQRFPFFAHFDAYIYSYEERVMKPDPAIYAAVERAMGRKGDALAYLDDRPENVQGGLARGWRAVLHETPEKSIAALRLMGLPV
jgi:HAD superfamily hydrolase (TIGR01509 family)